MRELNDPADPAAELLAQALEPRRTIEERVLLADRHGLRLIEGSSDATKIEPHGGIQTQVVKLLTLDDEGAVLSRENLAGCAADGRVLARESLARCAGCGTVVGQTDSRELPTGRSQAPVRYCLRCAKRVGRRARRRALLRAVLHPFVSFASEEA
ncbi:MAG: hypothetical protein HY763_02005 [Planctomycetes bacterium]|nr:hypothetical protein [Planctomycetota bacterium]